MAKARSDTATMNLFDWQPRVPAAPAGVDIPTETKPNGRGLADRISLAVADALRDCDLPRDEVARRMTDFLGERVPVHTLNAYASQARDDHNITFVRLVALCHAVGRLDLLDIGAQAVGGALVHAKYVPAIESAIERDRAKELRREAEEAERTADRKDRIWRGY